MGAGALPIARLRPAHTRLSASQTTASALAQALGTTTTASCCIASERPALLKRPCARREARACQPAPNGKSVHAQRPKTNACSGQRPATTRSLRSKPAPTPRLPCYVPVNQHMEQENGGVGY
ncbi:hypothetical protein BS50DRAFT_328378 [Corynespora cassiicola Philippines]|uniref:Uncharacterized protein n=1 Tax=Corynespora cassiicola Philippines TaxID=1448308 RepID=A0A2T2NU20_CORCC|nr:hypothetical protein BS50DRAFT_328378 [Corynespora cassiicola Philippines]